MIWGLGASEMVIMTGEPTNNLSLLLPNKSQSTVDLGVAHLLTTLNGSRISLLYVKKEYQRFFFLISSFTLNANTSKLFRFLLGIRKY